jgi:predicted acetyltransferase
MSISNFRVRLAAEEDSRYIWICRNDPLDRANSFTSDPISWEDHEVWFKSKLIDCNCYFFLMEFQGERVGQLRVELVKNGLGEISINVSRCFRGLGYAREALRLVELEHNNLGLKTLVARVKQDNTSSAVMFLRAGFKFNECAVYKGASIYEMTKKYQ